MTFDLERAKKAATVFEEWLFANPVDTIDISDVALSVWGYRAALGEIERLRNLPRADVAAYDRRIQEMAARIKELQDLIDKPPEEADWVADYHLLQSALDGPIIDAARKWHAAYRKAQNSNLMRAKEVKRLRAALAHELDLRDRHIESLEARIKELEAAVVDGRAQYLLFLDCNPDCTAWNFDELLEEDQNTLRRQARIILEMEEPWAYVQLREAREQVKLLEAAFLRSNAAMRYYQEGNRGPWPQLGEKFKEPYQEKAREALKRIKEGGKDE